VRVGDLEKLLRDEPDNLGLRIQLAGALREAGRVPEAIELYRSVATSYRDQGRPQQAIAVCKNILDIAPDDAACQELLAALTAGSVKTRAATIPPLPPVERPRRPATIQIPPKQSRPPIERSGSPGPHDAEGHRGVSIDAPARRSSFDVTPLPEPVPYHVADPSRPVLPQRRPSQPLIDGSVDVAAELDTRPMGKVDAAAIAKLGPQAPVPSDEDAASTLRGMTMPVEDTEDEVTAPRDFPLGAHPKDPLDGVFFAPLPLEKRALVMSRMFKRTVKAGAFVIRQGEALHPLFIIVRGLVEVRAERPNGDLVTLAHARDGEFVGEAALLAHLPSTIQVIAATEVDLLALNPKDLYDIAGAFPALWARLKDSAERRTRDYEARMTKR